MLPTPDEKSEKNRGRKPSPRQKTRSDETRSKARAEKRRTSFVVKIPAKTSIPEISRDAAKELSRGEKQLLLRGEGSGEETTQQPISV